MSCGSSQSSAGQNLGRGGEAPSLLPTARHPRGERWPRQAAARGCGDGVKQIRAPQRLRPSGSSAALSGADLCICRGEEKQHLRGRDGSGPQRARAARAARPRWLPEGCAAPGKGPQRSQAGGGCPPHTPPRTDPGWGRAEDAQGWWPQPASVPSLPLVCAGTAPGGGSVGRRGCPPPAHSAPSSSLSFFEIT